MFRDCKPAGAYFIAAEATRRLSSFVVILLSVAAAATHAAPNSASQFPAKQIRVVVPFAAGGSTDIRARYYALRLAESLGQPVIIENKVGAGGAIAAASVARSAPDGYTLLWGTVNELSVAPAMGATNGYDARRDFAAISLGSAGYPAIVASAGLGVNSVAELVALAKSKPGKLSFGTAGPATSQHLMAAYFAKQFGIDVPLVPYKGAAPMVADLISGQVQIGIAYASEAAHYVKAEKLKGLVVLGPRRVVAYAGVPTSQEAGMPGLELFGWNGAFAPAGTPPEIVARLNAEIVKIGTNAEFQKMLADQGAEFIKMTPAEFSQFHRMDLERWSNIVKGSGVKLE